MGNMQAMIFAAGLGTRLKPLTDTMPKALVPVDGKPLIKHVISRLKCAGASRVVVNVHHFADSIIEYLNANGNFGIDIRVSDERGQLLETGGGIKKASAFFDADKPVLIHNVDILSNINLHKFYQEADDSQADAMLLVSGRSTKRYLLFDEGMRLAAWTNVSTGEVKSPNEQLAKEFAPQIRIFRHSCVLAASLSANGRLAGEVPYNGFLPEELCLGKHQRVCSGGFKAYGRWQNRYAGRCRGVCQKPE